MELVAAARPRLRGVLHQGAFAVSLVTGTVIVLLADGARAITAAVVYAVSVSLLFGTSAAYHRGSWSPRARRVMQRLDHAMIYVLIAGTYTPFALLVLSGPVRWMVLTAVWLAVVAGVLALTVLPDSSRWLNAALYLGLGWGALAVLPALLRSTGWASAVLVLLGGVFYTAGALVYARRRPDPSPRWFGFHEVFHAFTLLAFAAHYAAVSLTTYQAS